MSSARLLARVPTAQAIGRAWLRDYRFVCNKTGNDGSAKANIEVKAGATVWGVLFTLPQRELLVLDRIEGGYERREVFVVFEERRVPCFTYASIHKNDGIAPFAWYKRHMVDGAQEFDLPADYIAFLKALPVRSASVKAPPS
jgi:hypothetical protein